MHNFQCQYFSQEETMGVKERHQRNLICPLCVPQLEKTQYTCKCKDGKCEKVKKELAEGVVIMINKVEYEKGEEVKLTIKNNLDWGIWVHNTMVEEFNNGEWEEIRNAVGCPCLTDCSRVFMTLLSNNSEEIIWDQKENDCQIITKGRYRFKVFYMLADIVGPLSQILYSNEFTIKEKSAIDARCGEKVKGIGPCKMLGIGYEFDLDTKKCIEKKVGGCSFEIPFKTSEECQEICEKKIDTSDWRTYQNEEFGFEMKYPEDWEYTFKDINSHFQGSVLMENSVSFRPKNDHPNANFEVAFNNSPIKNNDYCLNNKEETIYINNIKAVKCKLSLNPDGYKDVSVFGYEGDLGTKIFFSKNSNYNYVIYFKDETIADYKIVLNQILSTFKFINQQETLCTDESVGAGIGSDVYPIDSKYKNIHFLGQLFTAANCGQERLNQIWGVSGENYILGSAIWLIDNPSSSLIDTLKSIGYQCVDKSSNHSSCKMWELEEIVKVNDLLKLEPYYENFRQDDCRRNCG